MNDKAKIDALRAALTEILRASVPGESIPTSLRRKAFKGAQEALALTSRIDEGDTAHASEQASAEPAQFKCEQCGVDRFKAPCPRPSTCGMVADALTEAAKLYPLLEDSAPAAPVADTGSVRNAALEEAAKIVDSSTNRTVVSVAREIRSLKSLDTNK